VDQQRLPPLYQRAKQPLQLGRSRARGSVEPGRESAVIGVHARSDLADRIRLREEIEKLERRGTRRRICGPAGVG